MAEICGNGSGKAIKIGPTNWSYPDDSLRFEIYKNGQRIAECNQASKTSCTRTKHGNCEFVYRCEDIVVIESMDSFGRLNYSSIYIDKVLFGRYFTDCIE
jgi:hypothetical protein